MTDETRREAIRKALEAYKADGSNRTETIEYRDNQRNLEVVTINIDVPLLNPNNSRLRAQLLEHPQHSLIKQDYFSKTSQKILETLLSATEKYSELRQQLEDFGQQEPGIISRDGLLVNGNTRLTAVRELGLDGFDVAVLPADATDEDFFKIEMSLQLRKLVHQDYTFTNELLLVANHLERSGNEAKTINAMQWKRGGKKKLLLHQGYLALVDEIRAMVPGLKYEFFDNRSEFIKNLHDDVVKLSEQTPIEAETLKQTRITGLLLGLNKDECREMDEFHFEEFVLPGIEGDDLEQTLLPFMGVSSGVDPLDPLIDETRKSPVDLKKLNHNIGKKVIDAEGSISDSLVEQNFRKLHSKLRMTARQKRENRINKELLSEPIEYLKDVTTRVQELADRIPIFFQNPKFETSKFKFQIKKTSKAIEALQEALKRVNDE